MKSYTLAELAQCAGAKLHGDEYCVISGVGSLQSALPGQITFLTNNQYSKYLANTAASAVILRPGDLADCSTNALVSDNPYLSYARVANCFVPAVEAGSGIDPDATVHSTAKVAATARIAAGAVVGAHVVVNEQVVIGPNCVLEQDVQVGQGSRLVASVVLQHGVRLGSNCLLHPGVVIGSDGFGLANDSGSWVKVPQLGSVIIEDDVEIGANTTIDRGAIHDTVIRQGVKLDNQIQVAHNVEIGEHTAIAACAGIAGSARIGKHCTLAGGVGVVGHIETADGVHVSAMSLLSRSVREPGVYTGGVLAMPHKQWRKNLARIKQLDTMAKRIAQLEKQLEELAPSSRPGDALESTQD